MKADPNFRYPRGRNDPEREPRKSGFRNIFIGLMCVVVIALVAWSYQHLSQQAERFSLSSNVISQLGQDGIDAAALLQRDPCNRAAAVKLGAQLIKNDEYTPVIRLYQDQSKQCSGSDDLLPMLYFAEMGLSDFVQAEKIANVLVKLFPADYNTFGWRSEAREKIGDLNGAYSDMRKALARFPDPTNVSVQPYYDTARLAAQTGHPCDAVVTLRDYIAYDASQRRTQQLRTLMSEWQQEGQCASLEATGSALIRYNKRAGAIVVPTEINGVIAHMILDTGATVTLLTSDIARRAGVKASDEGSVVITTANGNVAVSGGYADTVSVGNARLKNVSVYVQNGEIGSLGENIDGLLGLSFLGNFQIELGDGSLILAPVR